MPEVKVDEIITFSPMYNFFKRVIFHVYIISEKNLKIFIKNPLMGVLNLYVNYCVLINQF